MSKESALVTRIAGVRRQLKRLRRRLSNLRHPPTKHCPSAAHTYTSPKNWGSRPVIKEDLLVLHSTESNPGTGKAVSEYLANPDTKADVHDVVDSDGTRYKLVPHRRKAWHVVTYNSHSRGIEQVGRARQSLWPEAQLDTVARLIACWSRDTGNPIRDARQDHTKGVCTHASLGTAGGNHNDPGANYPFTRVLALARTYR